jgi:hypothetical protein
MWTDQQARRAAFSKCFEPTGDHPMHEGTKLSRHAAVAKAIDYMLTRWPSFTRFLDDVAEAQGESKIQPDRLLNDRKAGSDNRRS